MKVAIIGSRGIPARYGGFEVFAEEISMRLIKSGLDVTVYNIKELEREKVNFPVRRVFIAPIKIKYLEKLSLTGKSILHAVIKDKYQVVMLLGVSGAYVSWLLKLTGSKVILNVDGIEWKRKKWNWMGRNVLKILEYIGVRTADRVVADSEVIRERIKRRYAKKSVYIPYGVKIPDNIEKEWANVKDIFGVEKKSYYTVLGRYVPENNIKMIINGYLKSNSQRNLVIVADNLPFYYQNNKKIIFKGTLYNRAKLFALRKNATAHFHGHSVGGINPSLLEAVASFNVIFAYDVSFNREVLRELGIYFKTSDELALLINEYERDKLNINSSETEAYYKKILKEKYDWDIVCEKYKKLIEELANCG